MVSFKQKGDFKNLTNYLASVENTFDISVLDKSGKAGVAALTSATPVDTGKTASSWSYQITRKNGRITLSFHNSNVQNGVPIAIIIQYGHATRNGGWVEGRDYINPALRPIFEQIANEAWKEVTRQ